MTHRNRTIIEAELKREFLRSLDNLPRFRPLSPRAKEDIARAAAWMASKTLTVPEIDALSGEVEK